MREIIGYDEVNSADVPDGTVIRGLEGTGDVGCVAIRHDGAWVFVGNHLKRGPDLTEGGCWLERLYGSRYEVLYRPEPPVKVGDVLNQEQVNALPVGAVATKTFAMSEQIVHITRLAGGFVWVNVSDGRVDGPEGFEHIYSGGWTVVHLPDADADAGSAAA